MHRTLYPTLSIAALLALSLLGCDSPSREGGTSPPGAAGSAVPEALDAALNDPDPYARARDLGALLPRLDATAIPEVERVLDQRRLDLGAVEYELLVRFWAHHAPADATAWAFKRASPLYKRALARAAIEIWAEADPPAAVAAVERALPESDEGVARTVEMALVKGWFQTDRPGLEEYIYGLGSGVKRQRALYAYALTLAASEGSDAAIAWAESIPDDDRRYKLEVTRQMMSALAWADVPSAERFCDAHCDGPYGRGMRNVLVRMRLRAGEYGGDVVEWVAAVPETNEQQIANKMHSLWVAYATWAFRDRESAVAWLAEKLAQPEEPEPWVRKLYGEYARQIAQDSPEEAIRWAERVEDESEREVTLVRIARYWRSQDEAAAEAWLAQSSLSERLRDQARNTALPDYLPRPKETP
jgi:hypothetical protein